MDETDLKDAWSAVAQPAKEGGKPGQIHYPNNFMVFKRAEEKKEAIARFTEFMHQPEINGEWLATMEPTLYLPITEAPPRKPIASGRIRLLPRTGRWSRSSSKCFRLVSCMGSKSQALTTPRLVSSRGRVLGEIVQRMVIEDLDPQAAADRSDADRGSPEAAVIIARTGRGDPLALFGSVESSHGQHQRRLRDSVGSAATGSDPRCS